MLCPLESGLWCGSSERRAERSAQLELREAEQGVEANVERRTQCGDTSSPSAGADVLSLPLLLRLPLSGLIILLSLTPSLAQINSTSLAYTLLPDAAAADVSLVTGQSLPLRPFTLTVLSNASHALVSFNVSTPISKIGWLGVGWGTKMEDAAMSVLWPTQDNSAWVLSHRAAGGHSQPEYNPSLTEQSVGRFQTVADASYSARSYTVVSYLRELDLPSAQILFPSSNSQYLNLTRSNNQRLIYAYSSSRPSSDLRIATLPVSLYSPTVEGRMS